jgi:hypothetical protein
MAPIARREVSHVELKGNGRDVETDRDGFVEVPKLTGNYLLTWIAQNATTMHLDDTPNVLKSMQQAEDKDEMRHHLVRTEFTTNRLSIHDLIGKQQSRGKIVAPQKSRAIRSWWRSTSPSRVSS